MIKSIVSRAKHHARKGFTLTELAIVLLCVSLIIGAIWVAGDQVWDNYRLYKASHEAMTTVQNIRDYYSSCQGLPPEPSCSSATSASGVPGQDITNQLDLLNLIPVEMRREPSLGAGNTPIDHPFSSSFTPQATWGSFEIKSIHCPPASHVGLTCFRLNFFYLSQEACLKMLLAAPINTEIGIVTVGTQLSAASSVLLTPTTIINGVSGAYTLPLVPSQVASWCSTDPTSNDVYWDFKLHP